MSDPLALAGRDLGRYHVVALLGAGGMGAVYEAVDRSLGRRVALKILPPELVTDARRVSRFAQEARTASALNHPHVIAVYDIGTEELDGQPLQFIAMERIDGTTLRDTLAAGRLPLERALELMLQITEAVAAAHAAGVVHRDLKPDNVMVSRDGYAKVLDFGLAKLQHDVLTPDDETVEIGDAATEVRHTQTGVILGSAGYMAPEQAQGQHADHRADLFALGCILYELVSARRAFRGSSPVDTLHRIIHDEAEPLPDAPPELQRIVRKALVKDREQRYQSARELAIDLRELLREVRAAQARTPARARTALAAALVVIAVVASALSVVWWRRDVDAASATAPTAPVARLVRLTATGDTIEAVISPDGKYFSYVTSDASGVQTLWLRQLATGQELRLVPPAAAGYWGHTFTPDGNAIVYAIKSAQSPHGAMFRISTLGGTPEHLLDLVDSQPSFSPDGRQMTFLRADFPRAGQSSLMVASADGSGAHALATRTFPELFAPLFFAAPTWAPDGSSIVATVVRADKPKRSGLFAFDTRNGAARLLTDDQWRVLTQAAWLPDMSGLVAVGTRAEDPSAQPRLWLVPYPSGAPRRITNDLLAYRMASLSGDGRTLVSVATDPTTQVWRVPLGGSGRAERLTTARLDGWRGVTAMPDGRVVFSTEEFVLGVVDADGSNRRTLKRTCDAAVYPAAAGNRLVYLALSHDANEVRVTAIDGNAQASESVVVRGVDPTPISVSPDGQWVAYSVNRRLWKARLDGSGATQLTTYPAGTPAWSPKGDRIAAFCEPERELRLAVLPANGGPVAWSTPSILRSGSTVRWTPEGDALIVNDRGSDRANLWRIGFDGTSRKLTSFDEHTADAFVLTPDGKTALIARGRVERDAIAITGFR